MQRGLKGYVISEDDPNDKSLNAKRIESGGDGRDRQGGRGVSMQRGLKAGTILLRSSKNIS